MTKMGNHLLANIFKALSHPTRLYLIQLLKEKPMCVCEILEHIDSEQSNASQHLSVLKNQGIVESKKEGLLAVYSIKNAEVYEMLKHAENFILRNVEETGHMLLKN